MRPRRSARPATPATATSTSSTRGSCMRSTSTRHRRYVPRRRRSGSWSSSGLRPEGYPELVETSEMGREGSRCRARRGSGRPRRLFRPCAGDGRGGPADPSNAQLSTRRRYATKGLAIRRPGGGRAARPRPRWPEPRSRPADLQHATPAASGHHLRSQCSNAGEHAGEPDTKGLQIYDFGAILKPPHPSEEALRVRSAPYIHAKRRCTGQTAPRIPTFFWLPPSGQ